MAKKKATKKKKKAASLNDVYNQVARRADTGGLKISAVETKRVMTCFFDVLEDYPPADAFDFIAKGLKLAGKRRR